MPEVAFSVDQSKSMADQAVPGHNRWHPDIPAVTSVRPGSDFRVECREWTDAQIGNNDSANDVRDVNLQRAHMLSGPIAIEGAEPGDLLAVEILDLGPCQPPQEYGDAPGQGWGYTGIFAKVNGGGFLTDQFPESHKAIWDFRGQEATSRHIPGVRYTGITHPGLFGTAPSADLLAEWNRREQALIDTDPDRVPPLALPPLEDGVLAGTLNSFSSLTLYRSFEIGKLAVVAPLSASYPALTLEQVHGALAFYLANQMEIDKYLAEGQRAAEVQHRQSSQTNAELIAKLLRARNASHISG